MTLEQLDGGRLTLKAGKSRFNLQTLPADDFPLLSVGSASDSSFSLSQRELKRLISQVQYAMAVQDIRYYLNGLLMQTDGNQVRLVATDGHRLAFASADVEANLPKSEVILPRKTIIELYKLLQDIDDPINIEVLANQVRFSFGSTVIISKVVDGKFPDYNRVIPLDNDKIFLIERLEFLHALQRAAILANEKFRGVRLVLKPGSMSILCTNSEQEEAEEELEIAYQGGELEIGFNINYLMDVLTNLPADTLQLAFGDSNRSTLVTIRTSATSNTSSCPCAFDDGGHQRPPAAEAQPRPGRRIFRLTGRGRPRGARSHSRPARPLSIQKAADERTGIRRG